MTAPLRFTFGVHIHQPVGNFDEVLAQHVADVYFPFLRKVAERNFFPIALHISGSLLEWLEHHDTKYLDFVGRLVAEGKIELLLAGMYEPILVAIPRRDRVEQIQWLREALKHRFGVTANGLWLTERVWEPDLAQDLAEAQVKFALVDDRHFLVTGFSREQLHAPFWTEAEGRRVALFPIDERLRYLIPFRPPKEIVEYFDDLQTTGHRLAVFADDGEKFGGWPGTKEWVYGRGWLDQFLDVMSQLASDGRVMLSSFESALGAVPSNGLAYLPSASYREMEEWSLTPAAATRFARLSSELGDERLRGPDGPLVRGGHWRNFLAKYPESNRMHKKMQRLSFLCRERGDPPEARRAIGRGQCNDAYWHGVFGGLYLPHLRNSIWYHLAMAEKVLRNGEGIQFEILDFDGDGNDEIWVHSSAFSAIVAPMRGGAVEELTLFESRINYADVLTRRREAYHERAVESAGAAHPTNEDGTPSIHDIEHSVTLSALPPEDLEGRALFVDRVLAGALRFDDYARATYGSVRSWARAPMSAEVVKAGSGVEVVLRPRNSEDRALTEKRIRFEPDGTVRVTYQWNPVGLPADALFSTELSLSRKLQPVTTPDVLLWTYAIQTVAKSERGLDETLQGEAVTARWPIALREASIEIRPK